jgi:argininosuccinate lyase
MLRHTHVNRDACRAAASDPNLLATDLAEYLVNKGIPFRRAHHVVGALVSSAERLGKWLSQLTLAELQAAEKVFAPDVLKIFELKQAMDRRKITGSPGSAQVKRQLARWKKLLRHASA